MVMNLKINIPIWLTYLKKSLIDGLDLKINGEDLKVTLITLIITPNNSPN